MNKTVVIACDEQGQYSVGEKPTQAAAVALEGADAEGHPTEPTMEPAASLDEALAKAKALFEQDVGMPQAADGGPSPFQRGFNRVAGGGMGAAPAAPMKRGM